VLSDENTRLTERVRELERENKRMHELGRDEPAEGEEIDNA
jgi:hypothetical protein